MAQFIQRLQEVWHTLGINQRVSLVLATGFLVLGMGGIFFWASRPQMELLYGSLDEQDLPGVVSALEEASVPYEVRGRSSIYVPVGRVHGLRAQLMEKGLPRGGEKGYELFDQPSLGFSDFMQKTNYLRALQGELARTIMQMDRIRAARVSVVMPKERLFVNGEQRPATASVFVNTGGLELPVQTVNAIRYFVANAVEGLSTNNVSVVDNAGRVLTEALNEDGDLPGMNGRFRARRELEKYFRTQIESLLIPVTGPSGVVARVAVELDHEGYRRMEKIFDPEGSVIRSQTITKDLSVSNQAQRNPAAGVGAELNPAEGAAGGGPLSSSEDTREIRTTAFEINESTVQTEVQPGGIKSISASIVLAQRLDPESGALLTRPAAEMERVREIVANTLGVRSQTNWQELVTVAEMPFDTELINPTIPPVPWTELLLQNQRVLLQFGALLLAVIIFLWFVKVLKRTRMDVAALTPVDEISDKAVNVTPRITPEMLNELVEKRADNVSAALQGWVREDSTASKA
jgi:flagellar M-ring protein FliF